MKVLSGIKPTGVLHLGNFISTILPLLSVKEQTLILIADLHALISVKNYKQYVLDLYKIFLSFGFNNILLQSDIPEISELNWILNCFTEIGHLNRSHAYKVKKQYNIDNDFEENRDINAGLYNYPVLMTADNIIFDTDYVSVGKDQKQHIEIAKEITKKINTHLKEDFFKVPESMISEYTILGYDGEKMSKSNNNTIPLMLSEKKLKKEVFKMKTNSKNIGEPKYFNESPICDLYNCIGSKREIESLKYSMEKGLGWGEVKHIVFDKLNYLLYDARIRYNEMEKYSIFECQNLCNIPEIKELKMFIREKMKSLKEKL